MTSPDPSSPPPFQAPGRWRRFACMLYESILLFGVVFAASAVFFFVAYVFDVQSPSERSQLVLSGLQLWLFQAWTLTVVGFYFVLCWRIGGQTLAMKTWHIRIIDAAGQRLSLLKGIARYVVSIPLTFSGLNFVWSWFDRDKQFLSDRLAGTRLIQTKPPKKKH